ncbi:pantothenate kinase [Nodosilinea sp. LEGE 07088]|uniref:pantothenate kinase n=1 Tax=Nodosilinea sp. LEGE 07088 TaxID=2777968 RepID=UPI001882735C|nr:pantothenate kinase [Nodosilinea sp. LEGE 07088]MBE9137280.1 pantothenate kinase [Nodosilinea sp. LEGE 07088]
MAGKQDAWLGLIVGNSRWHWGAFAGHRWLGAWHTSHLSESQVKALEQGHFAPASFQRLGLDPGIWASTAGWNDAGVAHPELWLASVVEQPLGWLADYPALHVMTTAQVPLQNTYATLGVDRALALVGAGETWGWPTLVIDCGTALTYTAGVDQRLIGGAILPGLGLQFRALGEHTDRLPGLAPEENSWPQRWATNTAEAIASGVLHTVLASLCDFITAWKTDWPDGRLVLTGGDSAAIAAYLTHRAPDLARQIKRDPDLGFWGLRACRQRTLKKSTDL